MLWPRASPMAYAAATNAAANEVPSTRRTPDGLRATAMLAPGAANAMCSPRMARREGRSRLSTAETATSLDTSQIGRYDAAKRRLLIGKGFIDNVPPEVWAYEVSGMTVLRQWFSYRKRDRSRPIIGDRRQPSPLGDIQPEHWPHEYNQRPHRSPPRPRRARRTGAGPGCAA